MAEQFLKKGAKIEDNLVFCAFPCLAAQITK